MFVHVQGWKIDEVMMNIFLQCWTTMTKLHTIKYTYNKYVYKCLVLLTRCAESKII